MEILREMIRQLSPPGPLRYRSLRHVLVSFAAGGSSSSPRKRASDTYRSRLQPGGRAVARESGPLDRFPRHPRPLTAVLRTSFFLALLFPSPTESPPPPRAPPTRARGARPRHVAPPRARPTALGDVRADVLQGDLRRARVALLLTSFRLRCLRSLGD